MIMTEGNLQFAFTDAVSAVKFDDTIFYRKYFSERMPGAKGVDFVVLTKDRLMLIEVKNCKGYETENLWRINTHYKENGEESFDIEVAKKAADTIACMAGAATYDEKIEHDAEEFVPYWEKLQKLKKGEIALSVILFLEGDFSVQSRSKNMIMHSIQKKLNSYLKWLNANAAVVDRISCQRFFQVESL